MQDYIKLLLDEPWSMLLVMATLWLVYKLASIVTNVAKEWFSGVNSELKLLKEKMNELLPAVKSLVEIVPKLQDLFENKIKNDLKLEELDKRLIRVENRCEECIKKLGGE